MSNNSGYKTKQKDMILDFLVENKNSHVTVSRISDYLDKVGTHVGVTTIYRHLDKLHEQGIVRKFTVDGTTSACYQYASSDKKCFEHFHLKCEKCGKLIHLNCRHVTEMYNHILEEHGFSVNLYRTVLYGVCKECKEKTLEEIL